MFLRIRCERSSSHPVLKEVFPLGRSLSFPFFLSGQVLNSKAGFPGGHLSWLCEHRREQASMLQFVLPSLEPLPEESDEVEQSRLSYVRLRSFLDWGLGHRDSKGSKQH